MVFDVVHGLVWLDEVGQEKWSGVCGELPAQFGGVCEALLEDGAVFAGLDGSAESATGFAGADAGEEGFLAGFPVVTEEGVMVNAVVG